MLLVVLGGCGLGKPRPTLPPLAAETLLDRLAARRTEVTSLRARARVHAGLQGRWVRQAFLVRRPNEVRVDVLSPFGLVLALGARDDLLWAYPPADRTRFEGPATPANMARFLGAPVAIQDIVDILLGVPPVRPATGPPQMEATPEREYRVTVPIEGGTQTIWFAGDSLVVVRAEESRAGRHVLRSPSRLRERLPAALDVSPPRAARAARLRGGRDQRGARPALFAPPRRRASAARGARRTEARDAAPPVEDLRTSFFARGRRARAVDGVSFSLERGRVLGLVGGVGMRQEHHGALADAPRAAAGTDRRRPRAARGPDLLASTSATCARARRRLAHDLPGADDVAEPVFTVGSQIAEAVRLHRSVGGARPGARASSCSRGRDRRPAARHATTRISSRAACASA
jgi:hypothetical protein